MFTKFILFYFYFNISFFILIKSNTTLSTNNTILLSNLTLSTPKNTNSTLICLIGLNNYFFIL